MHEIADSLNVKLSPRTEIRSPSELSVEERRQNCRADEEKTSTGTTMNPLTDGPKIASKTKPKNASTPKQTQKRVNEGKLRTTIASSRKGGMRDTALPRRDKSSGNEVDMNVLEYILLKHRKSPKSSSSQMLRSSNGTALPGWFRSV